MKLIELSFENIRTNLRDNLKKMFILMVIFILLGLAFGFLNAKSYNPIKEVENKESIQLIDFTTITKNGEYYYNAFFQLNEKYNVLNAYLLYLDQVDMSSDSRKKLDSFQGTLEGYQTELDNAMDFYEKNALALPGKVEETIVFYQSQCNTLQEEIDDQNAILHDIITNNYTENYKESMQNDIVSTKAKINKNRKMFISLKAHLEKKEKNMDDHRIKAESILAANRDLLNDIINLFNKTMEDISKEESYEIIYNKRLLETYIEEAGLNNNIEKEKLLDNKKHNAIIYAKSIAGLDLEKERFLAAFTFFVLFGFVCSTIFCVVYRKDNN